ncbi:MAG: amino acid permease [Planctomycetota bacterium]|nr:amino acid permease [Planctomycetota bacterium]
MPPERTDPSPATPAGAPRDLPRLVGVWGAAAVMVGIMIGSGIFRTPTAIANELGQPWLILALWGAGGVLSLLGALTFSELACMYPQSGGVYVFLREGYGRAAAFVFGWTYMLVSKPLAAAGIVVVFAEHVFTLAGIEYDTAAGPDWRGKALVIGVLAMLTWINVRGVSLSAGVAKVLTGVKFGALALIVLLALALRKGDGANFETTPSSVSIFAALAPVLAAIMWTYDGWSDIGAIAGEVKHPQRNLPRAYILGTAAVTVLYVVVNAVYIWLIPLGEMRGMATVAPAVMQALVGPVGATLVTGLIVISTLGSSHGSVMTGGRVSFAQARDGLLFSPLARVHPRFQTPAVSLWVQLALSIAAVLLVGTFEKLAGGFVFTIWIFYGLAGGALFILRVRRPDEARPFRCPGYPVVPALFVLAAGAMTVMAVIDDPLTTGVWIGVLVAGFPAYALWRRVAKRSNG